MLSLHSEDIKLWTACMDNDFKLIQPHQPPTALNLCLPNMGFAISIICFYNLQLQGLEGWIMSCVNAKRMIS